MNFLRSLNRKYTNFIKKDKSYSLSKFKFSSDSYINRKGKVIKNKKRRIGFGTYISRKILLPGTTIIFRNKRFKILNYTGEIYTRRTNNTGIIKNYYSYTAYAESRK